MQNESSHWHESSYTSNTKEIWASLDKDDVLMHPSHVRQIAHNKLIEINTPTHQSKESGKTSKSNSSEYKRSSLDTSVFTRSISSGIFISNDIIDLTVHIHMNMLRNINTSDQSFECSLTIQFQWFENVNLNAVSNWKPEISFVNAINDLKIYFCNTNNIKISENLTKIQHTIVVKGEFAEHFELKQFPIDYQRLHVNIVLLNCPSVYQKCINDKVKNTSYNFMNKWFKNRFKLITGTLIFCKENFIEYDTWKMIENMTCLNTITKNEDDPEGVSFCKIVLYLTLERRYQHYVSNIFFPIAIETLLSFITFLVDLEDIAVKTTITLTIILTIFAVKFTASNYIPVLKTSTYMDVYFNYSIIYVCCVTLQNLILYKINHQFDGVIQFNYITGAVLFGFWMFCQIIFYLSLFSKTIRYLFVNKEIESNNDVLLENLSDNLIVNTDITNNNFGNHDDYNSKLSTIASSVELNSEKRSRRDPNIEEVEKSKYSVIPLIYTNLT